MKIRILCATSIAGVALPPDCVADVPKRLAQPLIDQGDADPHPDAVAYAEANGVACPALPAFDPEPAPKRAKAPTTNDKIEG
jgi:hypothetical protein